VIGPEPVPAPGALRRSPAVRQGFSVGLATGLDGLSFGALASSSPRAWGCGGGGRLLAAHVTIDESAAVSAAQDDLVEACRGFWAAGLGVFASWNAATLAGALVGDALGDPRRWGLDGAAAAAFLALLWPRLRRRETAAVAALVAVLVLPVAPAGVPVLAAAAAAAALGWWRTRPARGAA